MGRSAKKRDAKVDSLMNVRSFRLKHPGGG
jgi:hypothetical protein